MITKAPQEYLKDIGMNSGQLVYQMLPPNETIVDWIRRAMCLKYHEIIALSHYKCDQLSFLQYLA